MGEKCEGTDGRICPWGDKFDKKRCNTDETGIEGTTPIGSYLSGVSVYDTQDVAGNVWEWTSSRVLSYPYNVSDGREGVDTEIRVLRGGSWNNEARHARGVSQRRPNGQRLPHLRLPSGAGGFRLLILLLAILGNTDWNVWRHESLSM
jgi:formylglycine-generating enzyme required for sulfatase activity